MEQRSKGPNEVVKPTGNVLPFTPKSTPSSELSRLMREDDELREFLKFVDHNGLRERAVEMLRRRIGDDSNTP